MSRKWVLLLSVALGTAAGLAAVSSVAADDTDAKAKAKSPIQKLMIKMEEQTKAIQATISSPARFKKAGSGKDIAPAAEELVKMGKENGKFTEPAVSQKKPQQKWVEYNAAFVLASEEMIKSAKKKDYQDLRKALKSLDSSCSNCHGLFRPKTGGDEFGP